MGFRGSVLLLALSLQDTLGRNAARGPLEMDTAVGGCPIPARHAEASWQGLNLAPELPEGQLSLGDVYRAQQKPQEAESSYRKAGSATGAYECDECRALLRRS